MKVRTVTVGIRVDSWDKLPEALSRAAGVGREVCQGLQHKGFEVQTVRVATDPFESWLSWSSEEDLAAKATQLHQMCQSAGIEIMSVGPATSVRGAQAVPLLIKSCPLASSSVSVEGPWQAELVEAAARAMVDIAHQPGTNGMGCFRFCVACRCRPGTPFFPAAYHDKAVSGPTVTLGLENSSLAVAAFQGASSLSEASARLTGLLTDRLGPLEEAAQALARQQGAEYGGVDPSLNPSLSEAESLVLAYEAHQATGVRTFGDVGSLAVSEALTRAVQAVPLVRRAGYSGLMLPVLEDRLLAQRAARAPPSFRVSDLLAYSAVCGVGLDCVPLSGESVGVEGVQAVLRDMAALSAKHDKPLSTRLFLVPGGRVGQPTAFDSPYLCNTNIMPLS